MTLTQHGEPVNVAVLTQRLGGGVETAVEFGALFLSHTINQFMALEVALDERNYMKAKKITHGLKGDAANLSANQLMLYLGDLEDALQKEALDESRQIFHAIDQEYQAIQHWVHTQQRQSLS